MPRFMRKGYAEIDAERDIMNEITGTETEREIVIESGTEIGIEIETETEIEIEKEIATEETTGVIDQEIIEHQAQMQETTEQTEIVTEREKETRIGQKKTKTEKRMITETIQTKNVLDHLKVKNPGKEQRWRTKEKTKTLHRNNLKKNLQTILNKSTKSNKERTKTVTSRSKNKTISRNNHKSKSKKTNRNRKKVMKTPSRTSLIEEINSF